MADLSVSLFLVRHADVGKTGICYGQTDFEPQTAYGITAHQIKDQLPAVPSCVISSPLKRCLGLAEALYPNSAIRVEPALQEIHFGDWENTPWQQIERRLIDEWAKAPLAFTFPNGESTEAFRQRIESAAQTLINQAKNPQHSTVVVTHAGVIRLLLAITRQTPWAEQLNTAVPFASVWPIKL